MQLGLAVSDATRLQLLSRRLRRLALIYCDFSKVFFLDKKFCFQRRVGFSYDNPPCTHLPSEKITQ